MATMERELEFNIVEIKKLGSGLDISLSVRMNGEYANAILSASISPRYTIHAVLPYSPEFGTLQIGQKFRLEKVENLEILKEALALGVRSYVSCGNNKMVKE